MLKIVGKMASSPVITGAILKLFRAQPLDVMPCCSGAAPMKMEAQLGLLEVGRTARARRLKAPSFMS